MKEASLASLQDRLDKFYKWPALYPFKFIAPLDKAGELAAIFDGRPVATRFSRGGKYVSVSAEIEMGSSAEVIGVYRRAGEIEGVIAL